GRVVTQLRARGGEDSGQGAPARGGCHAPPGEPSVCVESKGGWEPDAGARAHLGAGDARRYGPRGGRHATQRAKPAQGAPERGRERGMSVPVPLLRLRAAVEERGPSGYLLTVCEDGSPHAGPTPL